MNHIWFVMIAVGVIAIVSHQGGETGDVTSDHSCLIRRRRAVPPSRSLVFWRFGRVSCSWLKKPDSLRDWRAFLLRYRIVSFRTYPRTTRLWARCSCRSPLTSLAWATWRLLWESSYATATKPQHYAGTGQRCHVYVHRRMCVGSDAHPHHRDRPQGRYRFEKPYGCCSRDGLCHRLGYDRSSCCRQIFAQTAALC